MLCLSGLPPSHQTAAGWMREDERMITIAPLHVRMQSKTSLACLNARG
jgi:hypothetical protein